MDKDSPDLWSDFMPDWCDSFKAVEVVDSDDNHSIGILIVVDVILAEDDIAIWEIEFSGKPNQSFWDFEYHRLIETDAK